MLKTAFLGAGRRSSLFFVPRPFRRASSTTPTTSTPPKMPWELVLDGGKKYGTFMAAVLTFLVLVVGTGRMVQRLQDEVEHEKEMRVEAVKNAAVLVDKRVLDLLFAAEYESLRSKLDKQAKVVGDMQQEMEKMKKPPEEGTSGDGR